ncbi:uncharacterized protein RCC_12346 [Ramularia collo-cygni]|uniref:Uncharacterized protein n=1 Tax=Ramularia collo-cygni TaxID=112498 RepID=A0A2D3UP01_9PEZI|nr:uncharacterized protein RCC_12346 [Ramularia collo-cygni]CZT15398.1 uncharacterized protein RCC_12346 [Ramularia collo-cygni]
MDQVQHDDAALIDNVLRLALQVQERPVSSLLPYYDRIERLFYTTDQLRRSVTRATFPATLKTPRSRVINARSVLLAACATAPSLTQMIRQHFRIEGHEWYRSSGDLHSVHLQHILAFQKLKSPDRVDTRDRLLLICSSHSLAMDFDTYERSQGFQSKHQELLDRLLNSQDLAIQQQSRNHRDFLATLAGVELENDKFDAGLRLGSKLRLIQACGITTGVGPALEILLGFECQKLSRLPYRELPTLLNLLRDEIPRAIAEFCSEFNSWWTSVSDHYHILYTQQPAYIAGVTPTNSFVEHSTSQDTLASRQELICTGTYQQRRQRQTIKFS